MRSQLIGIFLLLAVEQSQSTIQASCKTGTGFWQGSQLTLRTCWPEIEEVDDEDFTILSAEDLKTDDDDDDDDDLKTKGVNIRDKENIKFLPKNLAHIFPNLIAIRVFKTSVASINENHFKGLTKLKLLDLAGNKIENVTGDSFVDLVSLDDLLLEDNRIRSLGQNTFASLKALKSISLNHNEIQFLHPKIFSELVNTRFINLYGNEISSLDENIFGSLTKLDTIELAGNKLERIPKDLFKNNLNLAYIQLNDNKIKFIEASAFDHLPKLWYIGLSGNECTLGVYKASSLDSMRWDLNKNCNENLVQQTSQNAVTDLRGMFDSIFKEVESLKIKIGSVIEENNALKKKCGRNLRVDSVKEKCESILRRNLMAD